MNEKMKFASLNDSQAESVRQLEYQFQKTGLQNLVLIAYELEE